MSKLLRKRLLYLVGGGALVLTAMLVTDPDNGLSTSVMLIGLASCVLAVGAAHMARKALFDYLDMGEFADRAKETPTGAGLVYLGICIVLAALLMLFGGQVHAAVPERAYIYAPVLQHEQQRLWPDHPRPEVLAGLVEQESCISLTHSKCWNPAARLKTQREEGAGMGQITRAYRADGSLRFDALADMQRRYPELQGWNWGNVYKRPEMQLRSLVLMNRENFVTLRRRVTILHRRVATLPGRPLDTEAELAFADAAYNGGMGGVQSDRRACGLKRGCDPQQWFGHVEYTCTKSRAALYGHRSACDINRDHVRMVMLVRSDKYRALMGA